MMRRQQLMVVTDNGPEFTSKALDQWAYQQAAPSVERPPSSSVASS